MAKRLTALAVANLKPRAARYEVPDGSTGLRVVVQPSGAQGWCVRFRRPDKRPAKLTLDSTFSLAAARVPLPQRCTTWRPARTRRRSSERPKPP